jgi:hypothetical protein
MVSDFCAVFTNMEGLGNDELGATQTVNTGLGWSRVGRSE